MNLHPVQPTSQADSIFTFGFTRTANANEYLVNISRNGGDSFNDTMTFADDAAGIKLFCGSTDNGVDEENNLYFNNMAIAAIPEPTTLALLSMALMGLFSIRFVRSR